MTKPTLKQFTAFALLIAAATFVLYLPPSLTSGFVDWDDGEYVYKNPYLGLDRTGFVKWAFTTYRNSNWHPLTWLSYRLDHSIWGLDARGYHLTSALLHSTNTLLVIFLLFRLLSLANVGQSPAIFGAMFGGAIFGAHPQHVESVLWISERKDVLYAAFYLGSILFYLSYAQTKLRSQYILTLTLFALSLLSKPMAVTLPVVLVLLDFYPLKRLAFRTALIEKAPLYLMSLGSAFMTIAAHRARDTVFADYPGWMKPWVAVKALSVYLIKFILPTGLLPFYPLPESLSPLTPGYAGSLILLIALVAFAGLLWRRMPYVTVAMAYYLVTLFPTLGIIQVGEQAMADRYMYLPMLGPIVLISALFCALIQKHRATVMSVSFILLMAAMTLTTHQARIWKEPFAFWQGVAAGNPDDPTSNFYAGKSLTNSGRYDEGLGYLDRAISQRPITAVFYYWRGVALNGLGRDDEALAALEHGMTLNRAVKETKNPNLVRHYMYPRLKGEILYNTKRYSEAARAYLDSIALYSGDPAVYNSLGLAYKALGDMDNATLAYTRAIELNPDEGGFYLNRGNAYFEKKDTAMAISDYRSAAKLGNPNAIKYLASKSIPAGL